MGLWRPQCRKPKCMVVGTGISNLQLFLETTMLTTGTKRGPRTNPPLSIFSQANQSPHNRGNSSRRHHSNSIRLHRLLDNHSSHSSHHSSSSHHLRSTHTGDLHHSSQLQRSKATDLAIISSRALTGVVTTKTSRLPSSSTNSSTRGPFVLRHSISSSSNKSGQLDLHHSSTMTDPLGHLHRRSRDSSQHSTKWIPTTMA